MHARIALLLCAVQQAFGLMTCFLAAPMAPYALAPGRQPGSLARVLEGGREGCNYPALGRLRCSWRQRGPMCSQDESQMQTGVRGDSSISTSMEGILSSGGLGNKGAKRRRHKKEDLTPRLCMNLRAGGCYDSACRAHHGSRYFDTELGLWRTKRMFRQSTARPAHELASARSDDDRSLKLSPGGAAVTKAAHSDLGLRNNTFVLKASSELQEADARREVTQMAPSVARTSVAGSAERIDKSASSRAVKNYGRWRNMCDRCQRPDKVCICSSLPKQPIPIETRLIILQHPKERKKATYGTVPIVCLCVENVHVITANLNGPISLDLPPSSETDAGRRHMEKKHQHEMKRSAALCAAFENDAVLQEALQRDNTLLLFPDLDPNDPFLLERPELVHDKAVNLEERLSSKSDERAVAAGGAAGSSNGESEDDWRGCTLIAIDGTWAQVGCSSRRRAACGLCLRLQHDTPHGAGSIEILHAGCG